MPRGRPRQEVILTEAEKKSLESMLRKQTLGQALALRAKIVLLCADGLSDVEVVKETGVTHATAGKWRRRFLSAGLDGLEDAPRSGAPRTITDEMVENAVKTTLECKPADATHWSTRSLAKQCGLSQGTVARIWHAFGLKPHICETFKLSSDPLFIEKLKDVVGLYMFPPDNAVVYCVDKKKQIQALDRTWPILPMRPGIPERRTHDYQRHSTTTLFAALETATGKLLGRCFQRHRSEEFKKFLCLIDKNVPKELSVYVVLDNYATHKTKLIKDWLLKHPRYYFHFTPTSSSWLNLVERWFAELTNKQIKQGSHRSVDKLEQAITIYIEQNNEHPKPFVWVKTAEQIIESIGMFCSRINESIHWCAESLTLFIFFSLICNNSAYKQKIIL